MVFLVDFTSTGCYTLLQAIIVSNFKENKCAKLEKMAKNLVPGRFWHLWPKFGPQKILYGFFWWVLPLLDVIHCCKLSLYAMTRKTNEPNLRKWQKTLFWARFRLICPKFGPPIFFFFFKTWLLSHYISLPAIIIYNIRKKLIIQSWENLVTDGQTDRDGRQWFHRTLSN